MSQPVHSSRFHSGTRPKTGLNWSPMYSFPFSGKKVWVLSNFLLKNSHSIFVQNTFHFDLIDLNLYVKSTNKIMYQSFVHTWSQVCEDRAQSPQKQSLSMTSLVHLEPGWLRAKMLSGWEMGWWTFGVWHPPLSVSTRVRRDRVRGGERGGRGGAGGGEDSYTHKYRHTHRKGQTYGQKQTEKIEKQTDKQTDG